MNKITLIALVFFLVACTSTDNSPNGDVSSTQSGFLESYENLKPVKSNDDADLLRYIKPGLKQLGYKNIILEPIVFYPAPEPNKLITSESLNKISDYANQKFSAAIASSSNLVEQAGPNTARIKLAITSVEMSDKKLNALQYIPISFLITAASGRLNDMSAQLRIEAQVTDSQTGELLSQAVKSGVGETLDNDQSPLTLDKLSPLIDTWAETLQQTISSQL